MFLKHAQLTFTIYARSPFDVSTTSTVALSLEQVGMSQEFHLKNVDDRENLTAADGAWDLDSNVNPLF